MTTVIDASVATKWFIDEPGSDAARQCLTVRDVLVAPDLILLEVANAGWRLQRRGDLTRSDATAIATGLPSYFARLVPTQLLHRRALQIAIDLDHPIYDCCYLALAERERAPVITADQRLVQRVSGTAFADRVQALVAA